MSQNENIKNALLAQGIDASIVASMMKSMKPKKDPTEKKKKGKWFPGIEDRPAKIEKEVLVSTYCQCCGAVHEEIVIMQVTNKYSPDVQKLACSVCAKCPDFVRQFSHEELVSMILLGEKPTPEMQAANVRTKARLAKKLTPEQVITFTTISEMKTEAPTAATVTEEQSNAA